MYVKRDNKGKICSIHATKVDDATEELEASNPELVEFWASCDKDLQLKFLQSDLQLIRVLEDLIDILLNKNIITITDFPKPVIEKLLMRQALRQHYGNISGMEFKSEDL